MRLLTWLDVKREIADKTNYGRDLPPKIARIKCFSDAVEVGIKNQEDENDANQKLKEWFGDWYDDQEKIIKLDFANATLPIEFIYGENASKELPSIRPFWQEVAYLKNELSKTTPDLPEPFNTKPNLVAFHSFKGGVGRTLHLTAFIQALIREAKKTTKILLIDADLEAPGLTYWWSEENLGEPSFSFIDLLEVYHYRSQEISQDSTLKQIAQEVEKNSKNFGQVTLYFLPAFSQQNQMLDIDILPEHLVRTNNGSWQVGNIIHKLGSHLDTDYVFIDLRAGLSEISSPTIFDPRIQRFLVTTLNTQSIQGTELILKQLSHLAPPENQISDEHPYYDPTVVISMLTPDLKELSAFQEAFAELQSSYIQPSNDDIISTRLDIKETFFAQELLYINSWEDSEAKLRGTSLDDLATFWAKEQLLSEESNQSESPTNEQLEDIKRLRDTCQQYIYAESGQGEDLLITESLDNLTKDFQDKLPRVVSLGAKGAGKTFNYIQLCRFQDWESFLEKANRQTNRDFKCHILPLLQSKKVKDKARDIISAARDKSTEFLGSVDRFSPTECEDRIGNKLKEGISESEWDIFWLEEISKSLGMEASNFHEINEYLKNKSIRIIFLFDGLEDIFTNISSDPNQKNALKSLIENIPNKLAEVRNANLGLIIFLRGDFLRHTITQNLGQFEALYQKYSIEWKEDSFYKLVFWLCQQADIINAKSKDLQDLNRESLIKFLEKLWGKKLGSDRSKEAYSHAWVFAALTDFNGRLQARDIVRFLHYVAKITDEDTLRMNFSKWRISRLLPPQAIRLALKPCSKEKVEEAKEEYPLFKKWTEDVLPKYNDKKIPFALEQFGIDLSTSEVLKNMGVIYEDIDPRNPDEIKRYYIPEIFREGLEFSASVARPRVLALKRRILKSRGN